MLILKSFIKESWSVDSAPKVLPQPKKDIHFHCAQGFATRILAHMLDSLVRVSRRADQDHFANISFPWSFTHQQSDSHGDTSFWRTNNPCWQAHDQNADSQKKPESWTYTTLIFIASLLASSRTFNSLFKVLCIFPSQYLFAIGLSPIFSFRWNLPPYLVTSRKVTDS